MIADCVDLVDVSSRHAERSYPMTHPVGPGLLPAIEHHMRHPEA